MVRYKCHVCKLIINDEDLVEGKCPQCQHEPKKMCENDCICHCAKDIHDVIDFCPICGEQCCPECGSHDVTQISRVTGSEGRSRAFLYRDLQEVSGWNRAKQAELKDRVHYTIA